MRYGRIVLHAPLWPLGVVQSACSLTTYTDLYYMHYIYTLHLFVSLMCSLQLKLRTTIFIMLQYLTVLSEWHSYCYNMIGKKSCLWGRTTISLFLLAHHLLVQKRRWIRVWAITSAKSVICSCSDRPSPDPQRACRDINHITDRTGKETRAAYILLQTSSPTCHMTCGNVQPPGRSRALAVTCNREVNKALVATSIFELSKHRQLFLHILNNFAEYPVSFVKSPICNMQHKKCL